MYYCDGIRTQKHNNRNKLDDWDQNRITLVFWFSSKWPCLKGPSLGNTHPYFAFTIVNMRVVAMKRLRQIASVSFGLVANHSHATQWYPVNSCIAAYSSNMNHGPRRI